MTDYDSDSSFDDGPGGTETNVILGFASENPSGGPVSHLGGHPIWLDPDRTPPAALAQCKVCNGYMSLLLQLNTELRSRFPDDERRLHVFCCRKKQCSRKIGSMRAFRETRRQKTKSQQSAQKGSGLKKETTISTPVDLGVSLFGASALSTSQQGTNPFSISSATASIATANPFASKPLSELAAKPPQTPQDNPEPPTTTFAEKLKLTSPSTTTLPSIPPSEPWPPTSSFPPPFPTIDLDSATEFLYPSSQTSKSTLPAAGPSRSIYDAEDDSTSPTHQSTIDKDLFESALDKTFQHFSDTLSHNPEQVLRYEFGGQPLLYSSTDAVASRFISRAGKAAPGVPRCEMCGAKRVFECQLVPGAIRVLEDDDWPEGEMDLEEGMEWGTVIVGVCGENCVEDGGRGVVFREEWVGVQWEERVVRK